MRLAASFWQSKTTWTAVVAIVTAISSFATGQASLFSCLGMILAALGAAFLRDAIVQGPQAGAKGPS